MKNKIRKEFTGNVLVTISNDEVRLWVCNDQGSNIFRFKAIGKIFRTNQDITVLPFKKENKKKDEDEEILTTDLFDPDDPLYDRVFGDGE
jgi:hypothetical protein